MSDSLRIGLLAAVVVLGLGTALWVFLPAFQGTESARRALGSNRLTFGAWVTVFVLNGLITAPLEPLMHFERGFTAGTFLVAALSTDLPMLVVLYVRVIMPKAATWAGIGLRGVSWDVLLRFGVGGGIACLALTAIVEGLLDRVGLRSNQFDEFKFVFSEGSPSFALVFVLGVCVAPFVEELFFRGFVFGLYRQRHPVWLAYLVSSVLFTVPHLLSIQMSLSQMAGLGVGVFMLGIVLAWLYDVTGSLLPGMLAHAVNNATGLLAFYAVGIRQG